MPCIASQDNGAMCLSRGRLEADGRCRPRSVYYRSTRTAEFQILTKGSLEPTASYFQANHVCEMEGTETGGKIRRQSAAAFLDFTFWFQTPSLWQTSNYLQKNGSHLVSLESVRARYSLEKQLELSTQALWQQQHNQLYSNHPLDLYSVVRIHSTLPLLTGNWVYCKDDEN